MADVSYEARLTLIVVETDVMVDFPVEALSVDAHILRLKAAKDTNIMTLLEHAKAGKGITVYKTPSTKDDRDAVLLGLAGSKRSFGFGLDVYANYSGSRVHFVHFFQEDSTISDGPVRVGGGNDALFKIPFALPRADFKHASQQQGRWVDDDDWIR